MLQYHSNKTSAEQFLDAVQNARVRIRDVQTDESDLEDVFLVLTTGLSDDLPAKDPEQPSRDIHRVKLPDQSVPGNNCSAPIECGNKRHPRGQRSIRQRPATETVA